jgi:hypothetical protein
MCTRTRNCSTGNLPDKVLVVGIVSGVQVPVLQYTGNCTRTSSRVVPAERNSKQETKKTRWRALIDRDQFNDTKCRVLIKFQKYTLQL